MKKPNVKKYFESEYSMKCLKSFFVATLSLCGPITTNAMQDVNLGQRVLNEEELREAQDPFVVIARIQECNARITGLNLQMQKCIDRTRMEIPSLEAAAVREKQRLDQITQKLKSNDLEIKSAEKRAEKINGQIEALRKRKLLISASVLALGAFVCAYFYNLDTEKEKEIDEKLL